MIKKDWLPELSDTRVSLDRIKDYILAKVLAEDIQGSETFQLECPKGQAEIGLKRFWPNAKMYLKDDTRSAYHRDLLAELNPKLIAYTTSVNGDNIKIISIGSPLAQDRDKICALKNFWRPPVDRDRHSPVGIMVQTSAGMKIRNYTFPATVLQAGNYAKETIQGLNNLSTALRKTTSQGRLTILEGPPGTGKTSALKGLIGSFEDEEKDPYFVYLPQGVAQNLSDPSMISVLQQKREDNEYDYAYADEPANENIAETRKLVLLIEDGDILLQRRTGGHSVVTEFLNLCDGILGEILRLHIIVTTNLERKDLDPAIVRPGRLNSIIYFQNLSRDHAERILSRETGDQNQLWPVKLDKDKYTLAEVYAMANGLNNGYSKPEEALGQYM